MYVSYLALGVRPVCLCLGVGGVSPKKDLSNGVLMVDPKRTLYVSRLPVDFL